MNSQIVYDKTSLIFQDSIHPEQLVAEEFGDNMGIEIKNTVYAGTLERLCIEMNVCFVEGRLLIFP